MNTEVVRGYTSHSINSNMAIGYISLKSVLLVFRYSIQYIHVYQLSFTILSYVPLSAHYAVCNYVYALCMWVSLPTETLCLRLLYWSVASLEREQCFKPHIIFTVEQHIIQFNYEGVRPLVGRGQEVWEKLLTRRIHKHLEKNQSRVKSWMPV